MLKFNAVIISILILASCTTISVFPIGEANIGLYGESVLIYANRSTIDKEFKEIAIITAKVDADLGTVDDKVTMSKILKEAQMIGAHAVIFEEEDFQSIRVTAIKFTE